jgi:hypothetical protein
MIFYHQLFISLLLSLISGQSCLFLLLTLLIGGIVFYFYVIRPGNVKTIAESESTINDFGFDDLAPVDNAEQSAVYLKALKWALDNPRIRNVAVTGPYGSGKSSILETFRKSYQKDFQYLNISLASFKEDKIITEADPLLKKEDEEGKTGEESNDGKKSIVADQRKNEAHQLIELSILQQIFYKVTDGEIPDSRFKRIQPLTAQKQRLIVFTGMISGVALAWLAFPGWLEKMPFMKDFSDWSPTLFILLPLLILLPGTVWALFYLVRFIKDSGFKKLKISSGEIEINPKSEASILNKYLDELVYFFQVTAYNLVIIEDLDRFNDPEIFTKLRELNLLLNSSGQVGRHIVFVYAVRDDMFPDDRTRTKFFDFILPVIPVINWSNSLEKLKVKLEKFNFKIEPSFTIAITLYIDDMRVLKNIFNELLLYNESLEIPEERQTKLLAMIVYKNIYPHDFAALHHDKGIVSEVFAGAMNTRYQLMSPIDKKVAAKREELKKLEYIVPSGIKSLRAAYVQAIVDEMAGFQYMLINGTRVQFSELQEDTMFKLLQTDKRLHYQRLNSGSTPHQIDFEQIENKVDPLMGYDEREALVIQKTEGKLLMLQREIADLQKEKAAIGGYSVTRLINAGIDQFSEISEDKRHMRLLRYLLLEGYIDLSYPYLISYFYPGSMGRADMKFLTYVNDRILLEMDYALEKPSGLIEMLARHDFQKDVILNIDLLDGLIAAGDRYKVETGLFISQINDGNERALEFMQLFIAKGKQVSGFIKTLCNLWPGLWIYVLNEFPDGTKDIYLNLILSFCDPADLAALNKDYELSRYINFKYLLVSDFSKNIAIERLRELFGLLVVSFNAMSFDPNHPDFFQMVYEDNYYRINIGNIVSVIQQDGAEEKELAELFQANYSVITRSGSDLLKKYIKSQLDTYVPNVLLELENELLDEEDDVIDLYNDPTLAKELKEILSEREVVRVMDISRITGVDIRAILFSNDKVSPVWKNVLNYFTLDNKLGTVLSAYLDRSGNASLLGNLKLKPGKTYNREVTNDLELAILQEDSFSIEAYRELIRAFQGKTVEFDFNGISDDKAEALIHAGYLAVSKGNIDKLKQDYSPQHIDLYLTDMGVLLADYDDFAPDNEDLTELLEIPDLPVKQHLSLIDHISVATMGADKNLANAVIRILVSVNDYEIDEDLLKALFKYSSLEHEKVSLFSRYVSSLDFESIREVLNDIGGEYAKVNTTKHAKLPINPVNSLITSVLVTRRFVSSIKPNKEKGIFRVIPFQG